MFALTGHFFNSSLVGLQDEEIGLTFLFFKPQIRRHRVVREEVTFLKLQYFVKERGENLLVDVVYFVP